MIMIKFLLIFNFLQVEACLRTSEKKLPSLQTCTRESNFGKKLGNDAKIVGGVTAEKNQWPFIARLTIGFDDGQESFCGGTIIDNNWVLTYDFSYFSVLNIVLELPTAATVQAGSTQHSAICGFQEQSQKNTPSAPRKSKNTLNIELLPSETTFACSVSPKTSSLPTLTVTCKWLV